MGFTDSGVACDIFSLPGFYISKKENSHPWNIWRLHAKNQRILLKHFSEAEIDTAPDTVSNISRSLKLSGSSVPLNVLPPPPYIYKCYTVLGCFFFFGRAPFLDLEKINLGFLMTVIGSKWVCRLHLVTDNSLLLRRGSFVVKNKMIQVPFLL